MTDSSIHIHPPTRWRMLDYHERWSYRELAVALMVRDIKVRYRQTMIGLASAVLKPVLTMIVFSHVVKMPSDGYPYPVFCMPHCCPGSFSAMH